LQNYFANHVYRIFEDKTIIKNINPHGLLLKNDFDELIFAFDKVIKNDIYYSKSVIEMLEMHDNDIEIDLFDKQILFHLSKGTKAADIPQYIPISLNAIESRKLNLKELLKVTEGTDTDLVREARKIGLCFNYIE
jgi:DNA-binding NarL/FixJ family response regulator